MGTEKLEDGGDVIDRQEIMDFAREMTLAVEVVEKDYVLGWLLAGISNHAALRDDCGFWGHYGFWHGSGDTISIYLGRA